MDLLNHASLFALGLSSLFPLINPVGTGLILNPIFEPMDLKSRQTYALTIVFYCSIVGLISLFAGSWCLKFMGVSIPTTQMAGGFVIARMGLGMLSAEPNPQKDVELSNRVGQSLFYPLAFPITLGPGSISALITLSAHAHDAEFTMTLLRMSTIALALFATLAMTYFCIAYSHMITQKLGSSASIAINRLMAFLVFCVGIQMAFAGLTNSFPNLLK